jgi:predicted alpha/beta superfamily hydrolase
MNQSFMTFFSSAVFLVFTGCSMVAPDHPDVTGTLQNYTIKSGLINDSYQLFVRTPVGYDTSGTVHYPLIIQLDAELGILDEFNVTCGFVSMCEKDSTIPPTIVTGIGYPYEQGAGNGRNRDFTLPNRNGAMPEGTTGGAPAFYQFLKEEVIPFISKNYAIAGIDKRILCGHSLGGLFTLYACLQKDSLKPFSGFIAASPSIWFDKASLFDYIDTLALRKDSSSIRLYTTIGLLEGPEMVVYFNNFVERLNDRHFFGMTINSRKYNTNHVGTVSPSFYDGIIFMLPPGKGGYVL